METTLKNKLSNFSFVFLLTLFTFNSCSKDETISASQGSENQKDKILISNVTPKDIPNIESENPF